MPMRAFVFLASAVAIVSASAAYAVAPNVSNVRAYQRMSGSKLVDVYYDVSDPDSSLLYVSLSISNNAGASWSIAPRTVSGAVGINVTPGAGKHIVWNAGADVPGVYGTQYKAMVTASDANVAAEMIYIPAGSFLMGNSGVGNDAAYGYSNELPQHSVYLSGYSIGKYEVTRGEYRRFMDAGGYSNPAYWSSAGWSWKVSNSRTEPYYWAAAQDWGGDTFTQTDSHPVVGVTYYEAEAYCAWAGGHLPTEAQWEKASRWTGSYPNVYPWGNVWDAEKCNNYYDHNSAGGGYGRYQTAPVGSYPSGASPYGLQDMAGNVWEWCQDWYSSGYYSVSPITDPQGPSSGSLRVLRGGGWYFGLDDDNRCANRDDDSPSLHWYGLGGFRLAR